MAPVGILWGAARQRQTKVILSVAAVNGLELEQPQWSYPVKPSEFMTKFPYGKIPAFESLDGFKLIEGTTIARYLCSIGKKVNLLGCNAQEVATVDQWVHFSEHEIGAPTQIILGIVYGTYGPFSLEIIDKSAERLARGLSYLETHLAAQPSGYVALNTLTLADFVLVGTILAAATVALGSAERAQYPHVFAHYDKVTTGVASGPGDSSDGIHFAPVLWGTSEFVDVRITEPKTYPPA